MAPSSVPPVISIQPGSYPKAVIEWCKVTSSNDRPRQPGMKSDLSLHAKQHLRSLGWEIWYIDKRDRWEWRYKSPISGKTYISLKRACQSCIAEGGCEPQNFPLIKEIERNTNTLVNVNVNDANPLVNVNLETDTNPPQLKKGRRGCKRSQRNEEEQSHSSSKRRKGLRARLPSSKRDEVPRSKPLQRNQKTKLSRLIDEKIVDLNSRVFCNGRNGMKRGTILRSGIVCDCCDSDFGLTSFAAHADNTQHRPSLNIILEDGRSLSNCETEARKNQGQSHTLPSPHENDNECSVCNEDGTLILCDGCPSSFHLSCLGLEQVPHGKWYCPACCCRICNQFRCGEDDVDNHILVCDQCERKYHLKCHKARSFTELEDHPNQNWFCSVDCQNMFSSLQGMLGESVHVGADNLTCTLLKSPASDIGGLSQYTSKLKEALQVLQECFDPVIDGWSGRDVTADVIFSRGAEKDRCNYRGFYTMILERNGEVIAVATVRIRGRKVADVPFVATRSQFRKLGMCRILMNELEKQLIELGVERMVLPSAEHMTETWINSFGFAKMTASVKSELLDFILLEFQGTIMCHKSLMKP